MNYDAKIDTATGMNANGSAGTTHVTEVYDVADEQDARSGRRVWLIVGAAVIAMIAIWFILHARADKPAGTDAVTQVPVVSVATPGRASIAGEITGTGSIAARREMPVGSVGEGGQVVSVLVDAGDWVRKGQPLAVIDRSVQVEQAASLAAQVDVAAADARLAQANLDRALRLVQRGFISKADIDRLTATRDAANARVKVARAQLGETRARNNRLNIVAPEAGLVLTRAVEPGQVVTGGSGVLFRIAKGGEMEMTARLSEDDLSKLSVGVRADVTPVGTDRAFAGQIWQLSPVVDQQDRQGVARIALNYAPGLRPGGFATARIASGTLVAPRLPESAILSDDKGSFVYIVGKDSRVERRAVRTGLVTAGGIAVVEGLNGTEQVVLRAGGFLNPGDKVKARRVEQGG
ncbi:efflux RND transporter periplasmic adaptor subunit [Novosphingobium sp. 9U]|uniref:efflux RND transporter periplasmic adaptor subunit n=1 Tax=Novosphingobium sp. 9U TaxID=2653158 RepID=UPI0012F0344F|nr:efflux RND transporter periplasmic adaptor subunit [Novosphingobium sp. 9U]VWX53513.1 Secretion protein HylD [Novosphingobium sp. 9U]